MENKLLTYLNLAIDENKISHAFLVETKDCENTMLSIYNLFVQNQKLPNLKLENNLDILVIRPENNLIDKEKILEIQKFTLLKNQENYYKIYFIINANLVNLSSANKLLKTLEEPADNVIGFLLVNNKEEILETIKSRCLFFHLEDQEKNSPDYHEITEKLLNINPGSYLDVLKLKQDLLKYDKNDIICILENSQKIINSQNITKLAKTYKIIDNIIILIKSNVNIELCLDKMFIEMRLA